MCVVCLARTSRTYFRKNVKGHYYFDQEKQHPAIIPQTVLAVWGSQLLLRVSEVCFVDFGAGWDPRLSGVFLADSGAGWDPSAKTLKNFRKTCVVVQKA